ncbi:MAG TPA: DUF1360 domain-containing protein [Chloroflexota bacterium]|nr:DUF1360 domain-containing protein [Chloroflexota bacterium]
MPDPSESRPYGQYAALIALYNLIFGGFILLYRRWSHPLERLSGLDLAMLGLATLRLSKLVSEDEITAVLRRPLVQVEGDQKKPRGHGLRWALGKLVLCPTCTGTWIAAFLTYALHLFPRYTRPFLALMSASGISQSSDAFLSLVYTDRDLLRDEETIIKEKRPRSG